jgi:hypothetical protein
MVSFAGVNWLAVLVGVIFSNALGFLWYGPFFAKPWMALIGKRPEDVQGSPMMYVITVVTSAITMVALDLLVIAMGGGGLLQGALAGAFIWIGVGATSSYVSNVFEMRPRGLWYINAGYNLVVFIVMGAVFAAWR